MKKIGIDCGASTIKLVCTENEKVIYTDAREHFGSPFRALGAMVGGFSDTHPECGEFGILSGFKDSGRTRR